MILQSDANAVDDISHNHWLMQCNVCNEVDLEQNSSFFKILDGLMLCHDY